MSEPATDEKMAAAKTRMAELALKFLNRSEVDLASMRAALEQVAAGDANAVGDIRHLSHRMVGTGATLGYAAISDGAHVIERLADGCGPGQVPQEQWRADVSGALDSLAAELRRLRG